MFLGEHAADGRRLDGAEDEAGKRQRQEPVQLVPANQRQPERRQTLRNLPEQGDARGLEIQQPGGGNAGDDDEKRDGPVLQPQFAGDEHREGGAADEQRGLMRVAQVAEEVGRAFPEIAMRPFEPEELWAIECLPGRAPARP